MKVRPENWGIRGTILEDVPMKRYTSMKVGGPVQYLVYPADEASLIDTVSILREQNIKYRFLGNGTNIIVNDNGFKGAAIRLARIKHLQHKRTKDGALVTVSGGTSLKRFIKENAGRGLSGLEKLYWIPGTVGGGIKMNAGSFGASISDVLETVCILNNKGSMATFDKKDLSFKYRLSPLKKTECVVNATFHMKLKDKKKILKDMEHVFTERKKRHPMEFPSSGSVFKSADGEPAWRFVEEAGLRGLRIGDACVSEKHTNFIVNMGHATANDIKKLIEKIKKKVFEKEGIKLEEEVELWGFDE